jgi:hypothetical protein
VWEIDFVTLPAFYRMPELRGDLNSVMTLGLRDIVYQFPQNWHHLLIALPLLTLVLHQKLRLASGMGIELCLELTLPSEL